MSKIKLSYCLTNIVDVFGEFQDKYHFKLETDNGRETVEKIFMLSSYSDHLRDPHMIYYDISDGNMEDSDWESLPILVELNTCIEADTIEAFIYDRLNYWTYGTHILYES